MKPVTLYIHIPFCVKKCAYCDFSSWPGRERDWARYLNALEDEFASAARRYGKMPVKTAFIGGAKPVVLEETDDIVTVRSNLVVYRVGRDGASNLHGTATCHDTIAKTADGLRFVRHHVVLNESLLPGDFSDIL